MVVVSSACIDKVWMDWHSQDPYHPTSLRLRNSSVIRGMAVAMMVLSKATHRVAMHRANMQRERARPDRCEDWAPIWSAASEATAAGAFSSTGSEDSPPEREGGSFSDMLT